MKKMFIGFLITLGVLGASLAFNTKTVLVTVTLRALLHVVIKESLIMKNMAGQQLIISMEMSSQILNHLKPLKASLKADL